MSYSRVAYPRGSAVQRQGHGRGRPQAVGHDPYPQPRRPEVLAHDRTVPRPEAARLHNRGYQGHLGYGGAEGDEEGEGYQEGSPTGRQQQAERRMQNHGGHYVLTPNQSKNEKLRNTARAEAAEYERHKTDKRERLAARLSQEEPRRLGGQPLSQRDIDERIHQQEREHRREARSAGIRRQQKREQYQMAKRQREDEEIAKKRAVQRDQAVRLEERQRHEREVTAAEVRRRRLAYYEGQ